jgi:hypothetical protein
MVYRLGDDKVKKIILLIIPILLLCGCDAAYGEVDEKKGPLITFCDKKYGVEYIRELHVYGGGITVRLDENGNVIHCK